MDELIASLTAMNFDQFKARFAELSLHLSLELKERLDDIYYNSGDATLQDYKYDYIKDFLKGALALTPEKIGHPLRESQNKINLPYWLGSMDKIYPEDTRLFEQWTGRNVSPTYCVTEKLDGVSCLLVSAGGSMKLFTRGDGTVGSDISHLHQHVQGIPKKLGSDIAVRGELIVAKKDFNRLYSSKYANARNMVSGIVNAKTLKEGLVSVQFVAYEIIAEGTTMPPSEQLSLLQRMQFKTALTASVDISELSMDSLKTTLLEFKSISEFEIDGLVVHSNKPYVRNDDGNPKYSFAFKMVMEGTVVETEVIEVEWNTSKRGYMKPRAKLAPVHLSGVTISHATAFNAKFVRDNKLGPGAIVQLTRSGEVIPYIVKVVRPAEKASMPADEDFRWNDTEVDIISVSENDDMQVKVISNFFSEVGVKHVSDATVRKLFALELNTFEKIIKAPSSLISTIDGLGPKSAERITTNIKEALAKVQLHTLMSATGLFGSGIGSRKTRSILDQFPELFVCPQSQLVERIAALDGFSSKTAPMVAKGVEKFIAFCNDLKDYLDSSIYVWEHAVAPVASCSQGTFKDMNVVLTGFRDKDMQEALMKLGANVQAGVTKTTTIVVAANPFETSTKLAKARQLGIKIVSKEEFTKEYF
jgi:DNA ligase (NAD+)